ncbi:MAG TPA: BamA/TamA family outer membrane protein [Gemmatimonadales bacterium]|nr:BamA/TamA family outer membrane protein [Gemmatimonadales bacterium]
MRVIHFLVLAGFAATTVLPAQEQERVVRSLSFVGNKALDDYTLESAIATTKSSWWARFPLVRWLGLGEKRYFSEVEFRRDVVRLILLYRQSGYMNAVVDTSVQRTARDVYITFQIHEGDPVRVAQLEIHGVDSIFNVARLKRDLPLQVGDPFNRFLMQASADTIVARLRNNGYPYADVLRNFDSEAGILKATVELDAEPGPRMRIGAVEIRGLRDIDTATVRRVTSVRPGSPFQQDALYRTQRDLYGMGVFNSVNVVLVDSIASSAPTDSTVRVLVQLAEGPRHQLQFGAGYGTIECFRLQSGWTAHDFLGAARTLDVTARVSKLGGTPKSATGLNQFCNPFGGTWNFDTLNYSIGLTLRQPAFLSRRNVGTVGLLAERHSEFNVYTREAVGGNADVTFNARGALPVTLGYSYSFGRTQASAGAYCSLFRLCDPATQDFLRKRRHWGAVSITFVRDRVNSLLDPSEGSLSTLTLLHSSRLVGSDSTYEFNRGEFEIAKYYPIGRRSVFAWRIRGGTILPTSITLAGQSVGYVPPDQRFYGGGPNSVRGYPLNELGPQVYVLKALPGDTSSFPVVDTAATNRAGEKVFNGQYVQPRPTGGNTAIIANAELRLPSPIFASRMRLGLFVDAGQVWERGEEIISIRGMRVTPGVGVRFTTPLGPVRIDAAYNGYAADRGPLLYQASDTSSTVTQIRASYPPVRASKTFWQKIVIQFAVGQAF